MKLRNYPAAQLCLLSFDCCCNLYETFRSFILAQTLSTSVNNSEFINLMILTELILSEGGEMVTVPFQFHEFKMPKFNI